MKRLAKLGLAAFVAVFLVLCLVPSPLRNLPQSPPLNRQPLPRPPLLRRAPPRRSPRG